ncbi:MAG: CPBP family intramembrane glutamic endopeptidase [Actinomycetota bacterium]
MTRVRLACWFLLVGAVAAANYAAYGSSSGDAGDEIYRWSSFADGVVFYGLILGLTLVIAIDRWSLLALRPVASVWAAARIAAVAIVAVLVWESIVTVLPIEDPGKEQGLTPSHWEPAHAGAFAANVVLFVVLAPFVEELLFRGVGQSLLTQTFGATPAIVGIGLMFGAWHGLLVALLVLIPFGWALALIRARTGSVVPGMIVHALFNAFAIATTLLS